MLKKRYSFAAILMVFSLLLSACGANGLGIGALKSVKISIIYGSEKQAWLEPLIKSFNESQQKTADGSTIVVEGTALGSIEAIQGILSGELQPTVWSPASSIYFPIANAEWRKNHSDDLVTGTPKKLVLSPVVIAMWKPMAQALGWPNTPIGWEDIGKLATSDKGWEAYGYPEWGSFKFGHTHPGFSNSGLDAIIAQAYAGAGKVRGLTLDDLNSDQVKTFMADVQSSLIHYGTSTGFFATRMFERGPSYLSAAVMYENLIVQQETARLSGQSSQIPVVAIYPKEGTFWADHPYVILNAPWVTALQKEAAEKFEAYLLDKPQQNQALTLGFRPADPSIPLTAPLDAQHGVDISQPKTVLEIPSAPVIQGVQDLWKQVKKPVDLVVVMDTSGSMGGEKISAARQALIKFIDLLDDRDQMEIITFSSEYHVLSPLSPLGEKRNDLIQRVSGIFEGGSTLLYDTVDQAYTSLLKDGNPKHIRAVVVLTDGQDTASSMTLDELKSKLQANQQEGGNSIKLFTIAFGNDADQDVLKTIADITGGKEYNGDPKSIESVYSDIATFF